MARTFEESILHLNELVLNLGVIHTGEAASVILGEGYEKPETNTSEQPTRPHRKVLSPKNRKVLSPKNVVSKSPKTKQPQKKERKGSRIVNGSRIRHSCNIYEGKKTR